MTTYREQWTDPRWQKLRLEVMQRAEWQCENGLCASDRTTPLHVHHKRYVKGRCVWEYELEDLACLCEECHAMETQARMKLDEIVACYPAGGLYELVELLYGFVQGQGHINGRKIESQEGSPLYDIGLAASVLFNPDRFGEARAIVRSVLVVTPGAVAILDTAVKRWDEAAATYVAKFGKPPTA